jgi:hypothetical protein
MGFVVIEHLAAMGAGTRGCNPLNESGAPADTAAPLNGAIGFLGAHVPDRSPEDGTYGDKAKPSD